VLDETGRSPVLYPLSYYLITLSFSGYIFKRLLKPFLSFVGHTSFMMQLPVLSIAMYLFLYAWN